MGFFSTIFKGIRKVIKKIGEGVRKVVESKPFQVIGAVATAIYAPQLLGHIRTGLSAAGNWAAEKIVTGATAVWEAVPQAVKDNRIFKSITDTISSGVDYMQKEWEAGKLIEEIDLEALRQPRKIGDTAKMVREAEKDSNGFKNIFKRKSQEEDGLSQYIDDLLKKEEEKRKASLLGKPIQIKNIGDYRSSGGFDPLMSFAANIQSPYISYEQGQQLFGNPKI